MTVAPRGVVRQRHFGAAAIGLALFLFGVLERSARCAQQQVAGWGPGSSSWRTLGRWIDAAGRRQLLRAPPADLDGLGRRQVAAFVARAIQALTPASGGDDLERMFAASEQLT